MTVAMDVQECRHLEAPEKKVHSLEMICKYDSLGDAFQPVQFGTFMNDACLVLLTSAHGASLAAGVSLKCLKACLRNQHFT